MRGKRNTLADIFSRKIVDDNGCWLWTGSTYWNGYGRATYNGKTYKIHRLSAHYYLKVELNSSELVLHRKECKSRKCFNPEHLYVGDYSQNALDRDKKIYCKRGHELTFENTYAGNRCRECSVESSRQAKINTQEKD